MFSLTHNNILKESEHNVTDYELPKEYVPGNDLISKTVLTDTRIISIVSKSLDKVPEDQYTAATNEFLNKCACDVLYLPKATASECLLIMMEVQKDVNENVSSATVSINNILTPATSHPFTIQLAEQLHPATAIGLFLCSQKRSIAHLTVDSEDTTMRLLYRVAMNNAQQLLGEEEEKMQGIKAICENANVQFEKIKYTQSGDTESLDKTIFYVESTSVYLSRQKRKFTAGRDITPIPETPALKYLKTNIEQKKHD